MSRQRLRERSQESTCAVLDLHLHDRLPSTGFVKQEQVDFEIFLANRFGENYVGPGIKLTAREHSEIAERLPADVVSRRVQVSNASHTAYRDGKLASAPRA
jgi:hypothetical protein